MSEKEKKEILENLSEKIPQLPEEQKHFLLGFMEGISQMTETKKKRKRKVSKGYGCGSKNPSSGSYSRGARSEDGRD